MRKICTKCKIDKDFVDFYIRKNGDAHSWCKKCQKDYNKSEERLKKSREYDKIRNATAERKRAEKEYKSKPRAKEIKKLYEKNRRITDPLYRLARAIRVRTNSAINRNGFTKKSSLTEYLGCSFEEFKIYIELNFQDGMNWNNHGFGEDKWHFDHTIPLCSAKNSEEFFKLCHYKNIKPMWQPDNLRKNKYVY